MNLLVVEKLAKKTGLFNNVLRFTEPPLVHPSSYLRQNGSWTTKIVLVSMTHSAIETVQLALSHIALDHYGASRPYSFPYSQQMVYSHPETCKLFGGPHDSEVNIHYALNIVNFFKVRILVSQCLYMLKFGSTI